LVRVSMLGEVSAEDAVSAGTMVSSAEVSVAGGEAGQAVRNRRVRRV